MFTGIVEATGMVARRDDSLLQIKAQEMLEDVTLGASIAVNGCCLTVVSWNNDEGTFDVEVTEETFQRTQLADLNPGDTVNLERPVRLADRLGGHLVQGHVDSVGTIVEAAPNLKVKVGQELQKYLVEKGSVTVDGVSLTIVDPSSDGFTVAVIPHTMEITTLGRKGPGDKVNVEVDVMAKYAESLLAGHKENGTEQ